MSEYDNSYCSECCDHDSKLFKDREEDGKPIYRCPICGSEFTGNPGR